MLGRFARLVIDALLPPLCLSCQAPVAEPGALCPKCWSGFGFVVPPYCARCGLPFEIDAGPESVCGACAGDPPLFDRARAVFLYDDSTRRLILRFKHADRLDGAPAFGRWMARAGADILDGADYLVPVPLHRWRLAMRRYNQAAVLALAVSRLCGVPAEPGLLLRARRTVPQGHLGRAGRQSNVAGAFTLAAGASDRLAGKRVVLVDDVLTSGATAGECARVLRKGGASGVDVLTLARVGKTE